jgi:hypothetical protein
MTFFSIFFLRVCINDWIFRARATLGELSPSLLAIA